MKTQTLMFQDVKLTFAEVQEGEWLVPLKSLGAALGYSQGGQKLCNLVGEKWSKDWLDSDFRLLQGDQLAEMKKEIPAWEVPPKAPALMCVSMSGLNKVLMKSGAKAALEFRKFIAVQGQEMLGGQQLQTKSHPNRVSHPSRVSVPSPSSMEELRRQLTWMRRNTLISPAEERALCFRATELLLQRIAKDQGVPLTATLPIPTEPKTPLLPAQNTIPHAPPESQLLIGPHPKCPGFLPAEDIGKPFNMSADFVKGFLKKYAAELNVESPRALAERHQDLHKVKPMDTLGYLVFHHPTISAYAKYEEISGGKMVWRNYWSPDIVQEIRSRIEASIAEKKSDGAQKNFTGMSPQA